MKNALKSIFILAFIALSGCRQRDRVADFVKQYNELTRSQSFAYAIGSRGIINRSSAEIIPHEGNRAIKDVKVTFFTGLSADDPDIDIYKEMVPLSFVNIIQNNRLAGEILDRGARFQVVFSSRNGRKLNELIIDKAKYQELIAGKGDTQKNMSGAGSPNNGQLEQLLGVLNKGLPIIIDKELNIRLTNISLNDQNRLIYKVIFGSKNAELLKGPDAAELLKEDIMRNPNFSQIFNKARSFGVKGITYLYYNKKQQLINEVHIDNQDF